MTMAAIYARVSSERQREEHTIGSQILALTELAKKEGFTVADYHFQGSTTYLIFI